MSACIYYSTSVSHKPLQLEDTKHLTDMTHFVEMSTVGSYQTTKLRLVERAVAMVFSISQTTVLIG